MSHTQDQTYETGGSAEAPRAAHHRKAAPRPETLRRLVPRALALAVLAGSTAGLFVGDKVIRLTVDGIPRVLHTYADDVGELLADEGLDIGAHDIVAPAPTAALAGGDEVVVRHGRLVRLTLDGHARRIWTTARTADEALGRLGVRADGAHLSVSRSQRIGLDGMRLDVRTLRVVTVTADGWQRTIRTSAATVREAVEEAGVRLHRRDALSAAPGSFPRAGQTVDVTRDPGGGRTQGHRNPFEEPRTVEPLLSRNSVGAVREAQHGARSGQAGPEPVRKPSPRTGKAGPRPGPKPRPRPKPPTRSVPGTDALNWRALAHCESSGRPWVVDPSGTYGGLYQFDGSTWRSVGGRGRPQDASPAEQTYRAKKLYARRGTAPWPHCGRLLYG